MPVLPASGAEIGGQNPEWSHTITKTPEQALGFLLWAGRLTVLGSGRYIFRGGLIGARAGIYHACAEHGEVMGVNL
jgi:hypothetical protein